MNPVVDPLIIYTCSGELYVIYAMWSIASLHKHHYDSIEMVVSNEEEKALFKKYYPDIPCRVVAVALNGYPSFSYKPFALNAYIRKYGIQEKGKDIVICDADVLWRENPQDLFGRFSGRHWFHKITAVNPSDFDKDIKDVPASNIGLRTALNYKKQCGLSHYRDFIVNAGLFLVPEKMFVLILQRWMESLLRLPPSEMLMSESILSQVYADLQLVPESDNVKYSDSACDPVSLPVARCRKTAPPQGMRTGYEIARHYYSDQRQEMFQDVKREGLDERLGLLPRAVSLYRKQRWQKRVKKMKKVLRKVFSEGSRTSLNLNGD